MKNKESLHYSSGGAARVMELDEKTTTTMLTITLFIIATFLYTYIVFLDYTIDSLQQEIKMLKIIIN